jgi:hypothetical protein
VGNVNFKWQSSRSATVTASASVDSPVVELLKGLAAAKRATDQTVTRRGMETVAGYSLAHCEICRIADLVPPMSRPRGQH